MNNAIPGLVFLLIVFCFLYKFLSHRQEFLQQSPQERQWSFVVDMCDGNEAQAKRILDERMLTSPGIIEKDAILLIYLDLQNIVARDFAFTESCKKSNLNMQSRRRTDHLGILHGHDI